jgi:L-arabinose transport system ATP-binding protein
MTYRRAQGEARRMTAALDFQHITKVFPGVTALDDISLSVAAGSVTGLIGENGAGKSTLLKILSGSYHPTGGELRIEGRRCAFRSARDGISSGVAVIYQELNLVPEMSVAENMLLGHLPTRLGFLDRGALMARARASLAAVADDIDPARPVKSLSIGQRQMVETAKALVRDARILAFDEPTSSLSDREVRRLFATIRELKAQGRVVIYVSHRLEEIFEICDSLAVLRDGRLVRQYASIQGVTRAMLVTDMVGRSIADIYSYRPRAPGETALSVEGIAGPGLSQPASIQVKRGEILGVFGLVGAGRTELLRLICGAQRPTAGAVSLDGKRVRVDSVRRAIRAGVMLCPEDRKLEGIIPIRSVMENINISVRRTFSAAGFFIRRSREERNADRFIELLRIRTPGRQQKVMYLSGGNQQKVILARWLGEDLRVLLMDEPTRGIDVGAKNEIYNLIYGLAEKGIGIIVVSSDLPEVLGVSDRVAVMREGAVVASLPRAEATQERVLSLALPQAGRA